MQKFNFSLALAAGLLGGFLSRNLTLPLAHAAAVTKEVRAQSFTLVDGMDRAVGTFTVDPTFEVRRPNSSIQGKIVLRDAGGHELWSAGGSAIRPLTENTR
jgi:hypothetical protein